MCMCVYVHMSKQGTHSLIPRLPQLFVPSEQMLLSIEAQLCILRECQMSHTHFVHCN